MMRGLVGVCLMCATLTVQAGELWRAAITDRSRGTFLGIAAASTGMTDIVVYDAAGKFIDRYRGVYAKPNWRGWRVDQEGRGIEEMSGVVVHSPGFRQIDLRTSTARVLLQIQGNPGSTAQK